MMESYLPVMVKLAVAVYIDGERPETVSKLLLTLTQVETLAVFFDLIDVVISLRSYRYL